MEIYKRTGVHPDLAGSQANSVPPLPERDMNRPHVFMDIQLGKESLGAPCSRAVFGNPWLRQMLAECVPPAAWAHVVKASMHVFSSTEQAILQQSHASRTSVTSPSNSSHVQDGWCWKCLRTRRRWLRGSC